MQADNNKRKLPTSAEIVDLPPPASTSTSTSSEISFKPEDDIYRYDKIKQRRTAASFSS
jgi:hypothetical protein